MPLRWESEDAIASERISIGNKFRSHDRDKSGKLDTEELGSFLRVCGLAPSCARITKLQERYDENKDGDMSITEMQEMYLDLRLPTKAEDEAELAKAFKVCFCAGPPVAARLRRCGSAVSPSTQ